MARMYEAGPENRRRVEWIKARCEEIARETAEKGYDPDLTDELLSYSQEFIDRVNLETGY